MGGGLRLMGIVISLMVLAGVVHTAEADDTKAAAPSVPPKAGSGRWRKPCGSEDC